PNEMVQHKKTKIFFVILGISFKDTVRRGCTPRNKAKGIIKL
ncbi:MAG: hypothetical protein ACI9Y7_000707, partial [Dokdonia sp.]